MILSETATTRLRRFRAGDLRAFQAYRSDPVVAEFQSWTAMNDDKAAAFLSDMATCGLLRAGAWTQIALADPETDGLIGDMGLHLSADGAEAEVGITLARSHQRQGHGTAAMACAFDVIWTHSDARTIVAYADQRNVASVALLQKSAMKHIKTETADDDVVEDVFGLNRPA